jgi:uncharacterized repeat protein (TIGR01451 family)
MNSPRLFAGLATAVATVVALCAAAPFATAQTVQRPDITVSIDGPPDMQHGRDGGYLLTIKNAGYAAASRVVVTLTLPPGLEPSPAHQPGPGYPLVNSFPSECRVPSLSTVVCTYNTIASFETKTALIGLRAGASTAAGVLSATAVVQQGTAESNTANNTGTMPVLVSNFTPQVTFPVNSGTFLLCMGKVNLLDCGSYRPSPLRLDANGRWMTAGGGFVASAPQPGTMVMELYNASNALVATWTMTTFGSRCYQGPAVYHTLGATYEARVCY